MGKSYWVDQKIENRFKKFGQNPLNRQVIDSIKKDAQTVSRSDEALKKAVSLTKDVYKTSGKTLSQDEATQTALTAMLKAGIESKIEYSDLPKGHDKMKHYAASGLIAISTTKTLDKFLPRSWAKGLGLAIADVVGIGKEVVDKIAGGDFEKNDITADRKGARDSLGKF
jgi:hypothetical protein